MTKEKLEIPFEGNEQYYEGIRGIFTSFICSIFGVILYAMLLGKLTYGYFFYEVLIALPGCAVACLLMLILSFKRTNRVLVSFTDPTPHPKLAFSFLILSYILIGTYCALFFDTLTMLNNSLTDVEDLWKTFRAFLITTGGLMAFILAFSNYSINKVKPLNASK